MSADTISLNPSPWPISKKIAFRFFLIYFVLYILPFPIVAFDFWEVLDGWTTDFWSWIINGFAPMLGFEDPVSGATTGSGDKLFNYLLILTMGVLSALGTAIWSFADRKRSSYPTLFAVLTILLRYFLGLMMLSYGSYKVFKLQFPDPSLYRLTEAYGDSSPMGLAWTYMGASATYTWFAGAMEVIAGALLLFRRTTLLGALLSIGVMGNVFMMNMSYDIPVKLFSFHLLAMAFFLTLPDLSRILNIFIFNRTATPRNLALALDKKWKRITRIVLKVAFIGYAVLWAGYETAGMLSEYGQNAPKPPLYGIYDVDTFVLNCDQVPPLTTDSTRWERLIVNYPNSARVENMRDEKHYFQFVVDTTGQTLHMQAFADSTDTFAGNYSAIDSTGMEFAGRRGEDSLVIRMTRFDEKKFLLINRGFHWVSEIPYNR